MAMADVTISCTSLEKATRVSSLQLIVDCSSFGAADEVNKVSSKASHVSEGLTLSTGRGDGPGATHGGTGLS